VTEFSEGALSVMMNYGWPGNVRELENVVQRAVILASDKMIRQAHLVNIVDVSSRPTSTCRRPANSSSG